MTKLTMRDIAEMAGVSYTTVSRALNGERYVKPETYEKIMEVCQSTGYTPNAVARQLKMGRSNTIGIVVPDLANPFFSDLAREIEWSVRRQGYTAFVTSSFYDYAIEAENLEALLRNRIDGIIISGVGDRSPDVILACASRVPTVFIGDNIPADGVSSVSVNNHLGAQQAAEYLIGLGHRHLAFLGGRASSRTHRYRFEGFAQAALAAGVKHEFFTASNGSLLEDGYRCMTRFCEQKRQAGDPLPTALLAISDHFALGVIQACDEQGISIPGELSIVGFDNISLSALPHIGLTTVAQPVGLMCEHAVTMLLELLQGGESTPATNKLRIDPPDIVVRGTCAPPS